ncbi:hypothetical protein [Actinomadura rubrisoli]|uniref:Uncharacterized protein n=1 Tax=Actinomadura rubrisoli TaxID=2530368 RepID=A0A4R5CB56_9ACTN|nr:hypothetical protein [Actinomadura rubrisoli]TDD97181.1 hypothetical protein E1298_01730 [Actinomadura rubrisoli]
MSHELIQPGELVEAQPVDVSPLAVDAAKAELDLEVLWAKRDKWSRVLRTLAQGAVSAALVAGLAAGSDAADLAHLDLKVVGLAAGQAALTAVVAYVHNKTRPKA